MKKILMSLLCCLSVVGCSGGMGDGCCGWSHKDTTGSGQVKQVGKETPIVCPDYYRVYVSLGVMRNGVGSMSTHDMTMFIEDKDVPALKDAAEKGAVIDFVYDTRRMGNCVDEDRMTSFKIQK